VNLGNFVEMGQCVRGIKEIFGSISKIERVYLKK